MCAAVYCDKHVCMPDSISSQTPELQTSQKFSVHVTCGRWLTLPLAALRYAMYFRFCRWRRSGFSGAMSIPLLTPLLCGNWLCLVQDESILLQGVPGAESATHRWVVCCSAEWWYFLVAVLVVVAIVVVITCICCCCGCCVVSTCCKCITDVICCCCKDDDWCSWYIALPYIPIILPTRTCRLYDKIQTGILTCAQKPRCSQLNLAHGILKNK